MTAHASPQTRHCLLSRIPVRTARRVLLAASAALALGSCAAGPAPQRSALPAGAPESWREARIIDTAPPLECVAFARAVSGIQLRGDAWTWWRQASERYLRGRRPEPGAVLVFRRSYKSAGHLAVVARVVSDRLIVVDHANWLNRGRIHAATPVEDVSARGDWSAVRVWYTPGRTWGASTYRTYGFIYPRPILAADRGT